MIIYQMRRWDLVLPQIELGLGLGRTLPVGFLPGLRRNFLTGQTRRKSWPLLV